MSESVTYGKGRQLQAGRVTTDQVQLAAGTYYPGMELESSAGVYSKLVTDENVAAIYNAEERVLASQGVGDCIMAGEINPTGLVTDAGAPKTLTETQRATRRDKGFYIKRV